MEIVNIVSSGNRTEQNLDIVANTLEELAYLAEVENVTITKEVRNDKYCLYVMSGVEPFFDCVADFDTCIREFG